MLIAALAILGGLGAAARHAIAEGFGSEPERRSAAVLVINVVGSAVLGVVVGLARARGLGSDVVVIVGAGLCGGFTTFSAYAHLVVLLAREADAGRVTAARFAAAGLVFPPLAAGLAFVAASA